MKWVPQLLTKNPSGNLSDIGFVLDCCEKYEREYNGINKEARELADSKLSSFFTDISKVFGLKPTPRFKSVYDILYCRIQKKWIKHNKVIMWLFGIADDYEFATYGEKRMFNEVFLDIVLQVDY